MRGRLGSLLISLLLLLFLYPLFGQSALGAAFYVSAITIVVFSAIIASGVSRKRLTTLIILAFPLFVSIWDDPLSTSNIQDPLPLFLLLVFLIVATGSLIAALRRATEVHIEELFGAVSVYLLLGLIWSTAFMLVDVLQPGSFAFAGAPAEMGWHDLLYYGYVSFATIGYGDITPVSDFARSFSVLAGITGTLFVAIVIAQSASLLPKNIRVDERRERRRRY